MDDSPFRRFLARASTLFLSALLVAGALVAQGQSGERNRDARIQRNAAVNVAPTAGQRAAENSMRGRVPDLAVTYDRVTGVARTINSHSGFLTGPRPGASAETVAQDFASTYLDLLRLKPADVADYEILDEVYSQVTGVTHVYMRQRYLSIPVYNGQMHANVDREGRLMSLNSAFMPDMARSVNTRRPGLSADEAVVAAADQLGLSFTTAPVVLESQRNARQTTLLRAPELSQDDVSAELSWLPVGTAESRLVWNFQLQTVDSLHWYDITVDAVTGELWTSFDWVNSGTYRVYEQPVESPNHTSPLPPSDARTLAINPEDSTASPNGWFDAGTTIMDGNNVHACADLNANNACDAGEPSCGGQTCDFSINLSSAPSNSIPAAITNLFYWNNTIHDIQYQYGFDEVAGNFQESNFGRGGAGSDSVNADAQDGSGNCNANFATPTDGGNPRMQMFTCTNANPARDGDFDNGVIVHEYGHGISIRQVGGPGTSSCLNNSQQAGEGWSDWFGLVYTAVPSDQGPDARGIGSYLFALNPQGGTIRDLPYSTSNAVNNWTYESISGASIPHGVGSRWAQAIWEVYWALVDKHGFDADLLNPGAFNAGNQRALLYVNEGLKNTACGPTFIDNRDGIIDAATSLFGGEDVCTLWEAFAGFGLGTNASTPGPNSTSATNGFDIPTSCQGETPPTVTITAPSDGFSVLEGSAISFAGTASDNQDGDLTASLVWSSNLDGQIGSGGSFSAVLSLGTHTVTASVTDSGGMTGSDSITVSVIPSTGGSFSATFDAGTDGFSYVDDAFRGTNQPAYADGVFLPAGGFTGGGLSVTVGGIDDADINNMSGGWRRPFSLDQTSTVTVSLRYNLTQASEYENTEFSQALFSIDGTLVGVGGNDFLAQLTGDGNGGVAMTTGFVQETLDLGELAAGAHTLTIGTFNNLKTFNDESTDVVIDDVVLTATAVGGGNNAPTVTINSPASGSTFGEGTAISFSGTASDVEDGNLSANLTWTSNLDGQIGTGGSFSAVLSVGSHTVTASVTDSGGASGSDTVSVTVNAAPPVGGAIDWNVTTTVSYSNQDVAGNVSVEDGGATLLLQDNTWRRTNDTFAINANTVVEFDFQSTVQGEIHGVGFDENDTLNDAARHFQLFGTQDWTGVGRVQGFAGANTYTGSGAFEPFQINVGAFFTGSGMRLVTINDNDVGTGNNSRFRNVRVRECTSITDFEDSTAPGWTNDGASTCTTGTFVLGTPTEVLNGGVTTQLAGDHSNGSGIAAFTAANSAAGTNDVDGGTCILNSAVFNVSVASDVSIWYYHGQRDAGDDPADGFVLEVSINGGAFSTLASFGDVTVNAAWQKASVSVQAGQTVQFRVQVTDGAATGDLIEAGVDDVMICPQ